MPLDINDIKVIQTEAQILGKKLEAIKEYLSTLTVYTHQLRDQQILTNELLKQIRDNTDKVVPRPRFGAPY